MNKALFAVAFAFLAVVLIEMTVEARGHHHRGRASCNSTNARDVTKASFHCALKCSRGGSGQWGSCVNSACACYDPSTCSTGTNGTTTAPGTPGTAGPTDSPTEASTQPAAKRSVDEHKQHNILFGRSADDHKQHNILFG